jgi:hypothetical protein
MGHIMHGVRINFNPVMQNANHHYGNDIININQVSLPFLNLFPVTMAQTPLHFATVPERERERKHGDEVLREEVENEIEESYSG